MIIDRLLSPMKEKELVIVPTTSLFIEAVPGKHPLLEDFKLVHRALDVKKVQAEVRHAELVVVVVRNLTLTYDLLKRIGPAQKPRAKQAPQPSGQKPTAKPAP
ncbi:MAG: hypothetical protein M3Y53_03150 [Thermoproteota archaeon]|nr:hypothetical protein [Thermoproteota archaeon]